MKRTDLLISRRSLLATAVVPHALYAAKESGPRVAVATYSLRKFSRSDAIRILKDPEIRLEFVAVETGCAPRFEVETLQKLVITVDFHLDLGISSTPPLVAGLNRPINSGYVCHCRVPFEQSTMA